MGFHSIRLHISQVFLGQFIFHFEIVLMSLEFKHQRCFNIYKENSYEQVCWHVTANVVRTLKVVQAYLSLFVS